MGSELLGLCPALAGRCLVVGHEALFSSPGPDWCQGLHEGFVGAVIRFWLTEG